MFYRSSREGPAAPDGPPLSSSVWLEEHTQLWFPVGTFNPPVLGHHFPLYFLQYFLPTPSDAYELY